MDPKPELAAALRSLEGVRAWADAPLAPFTTIGTGGKTNLLLTVRDVPALVRVLALLESSDAEWLCLGAGSNLLVADRGYEGVVVKLDESFHYVAGLPKDASGECGMVILTVGAASYLARLAAVVAEAGLAGMENACGIPGSVGGGVAMNAGAYGWCMHDVVREIQLATASGARWAPASEFDWGYRFCRLPLRSIVTAVRIELERSDCDVVLDCQRSLLRKRRERQPRSVRTFGSTFKNPPGKHAGRLIEAAGLKGVRRGGAEISTVHGNFVVNLGDATTTDVLTLMTMMRQGVSRTSGIVLEPEVRLVGTCFPWDSTGDQASAPPVGDG